MKLQEFKMDRSTLYLTIGEIDSPDAVALLGQINALMATYSRDVPIVKSEHVSVAIAAKVEVAPKVAKPEPKKEESKVEAKPEPKKEEPKLEPRAEAKTANGHANGAASRAEAQAEAIKKDIEAREAAKKDEPSDPAWMKENTVAPKTDVEKKAAGWDLAGDGKGDDPGDRVDPKLDLAKGELPPEITGAGQIRKVIYFLRDRGWTTEDLLVSACEQLYARGVQTIVDAAKGNPATLRDRVHVVLANAPR